MRPSRRRAATALACFTRPGFREHIEEEKVIPAEVRETQAPTLNWVWGSREPHSSNGSQGGKVSVWPQTAPF